MRLGDALAPLRIALAVTTVQLGVSLLDQAFHLADVLLAALVVDGVVGRW